MPEVVTKKLGAYIGAEVLDVDRDRLLADDDLPQVRARLGRPTILVNNAGLTPPCPFLEITAEMWNRGGLTHGPAAYARFGTIRG